MGLNIREAGEEKLEEMISMARRASARKRPEGDTALRRDVGQPDKGALTGGGFTALLESTAQEILAVTYWFDPAPHPGPYVVTVRFSGRGVDVKGRLSPDDRFVQDETIEQVVPGSGPISLTARVRGINAGSWVVTARMLGSAHPAHGPREQGNATPAAGPLRPTARFWRKWAQSAESAAHVRTCPTPFARVPGIFPGIWGAMVTLGMAVALALQALVIAGDHLALGPWWTVTLVAIVVGIAGAKGGFIVLHRRENRREGWCIQGFIAGATLAAALLLVVLHMPAGVFLDVTTPGLLVAMAVGRVGCFFAGCCGGPPTASGFGVWSSVQRVGARRIPTQLLELVLAGILGLGVLVAVLGHGPAARGLLVWGVARLRVVGQSFFPLPAQPRQTPPGGVAPAAPAARGLPR